MKLNHFTRIALAVFIILQIASCTNSESPSATMQEFAAAINRKDVERFKKTLSTASLLHVQELSQNIDPSSGSSSGMSVNEYIGKEIFLRFPSMPDPIRTRGESIDGNKATLYWLDSTVQTDRENWRQWKFVKEDGQWKIDLFAN